MREERAPAWWEEADEPDAAPAPRRAARRWLLGLAVLPWLVVLGLLLTDAVPGDRAPATRSAAPDPGDASPDTGTGPAPADDGPTPDADPDAQAPGPDHGGQVDEAAAGVPVPPRPPEADGPGRLADGTARRRAAGVALAVARARLSDVGPQLAVDGVEPTSEGYLEHAVVEEVVRAGGHAVVTLLAVVLERDGDVYGAARTRRIAVPVRLGDPVRPAGAPWVLDGPELEMATPATEPVEDPDELLRLSEALEAAEVAGEVTAAARTDGWWLVQLAPRGDDGESTTTVWVRQGPDGLVVPGAPQAPSDPEPPEERP